MMLLAFSALLAAPLLALQAQNASGAQAAQPVPLPAPPPVEKELAARASNVTEVTLGKNMLDFAAQFMSGKDEDDVEARKLIQGLDGIYVRDYEFEKDGDYTPEQLEQLRQYFETSQWTPIVRDRERKSRESTDVMVKMVNGESRGMFILDAEPKEISIVLILGPIRMDQLGQLKGLSGLGALGSVTAKTKDKNKDAKGGDE